MELASHKFGWYAAALILVGVLCIVPTYTIFSETMDEPVHLTVGLQLLTEHRNTIEPVGPPVPRILFALGPFMTGARYLGIRPYVREIVPKFHATGRYELTLFLARVANLFFFVVASVALALWARREWGEVIALLALLFFTTQPSILGHSGLATLDLPNTAGLAVALLAFSRWMERPTALRAGILGIAYAFSILCKLLCVVYVPLACAAILAVRLTRDPVFRAGWRRLTTVFVVCLVAPVAIWAGYGFSVGRVGDLRRPQAVPLPASTIIPAPTLFNGVNYMRGVNNRGYRAYLCGESSRDGWWWYFPFALALKTTLPVLLLIVPGAVFALRNQETRAPFVEATAAAAAILLFTMPTSVNVGLRYVLPVYVPLCVAAAASMRALLMDGRNPARAVVAVLVLWQLAGSGLAHPDYLAYFNPLAGRDPSRYLIDSNLDWGQDVLRLRDVVLDEKIPRIGLSLLAPPNYHLLGFPSTFPVKPDTPARGWIAVSDHSYRMSQTDGGWRWLEGRPYRRVGKSIRLFYVP